MLNINIKYDIYDKKKSVLINKNILFVIIDIVSFYNQFKFVYRIGI